MKKKLMLAYYIAVAIFVALAFASCATAKYDCASRGMVGYPGFKPSK